MWGWIWATRLLCPADPPNEEVLDQARRTNQIVVTSDLGMILLCAEAGQSVIWIDARGRQLPRSDMVLLVFKQIHDWEEQLANADGPLCLRAMRAKTNTLEPDAAARLVRDRMKRISPARKPRKRTTRPGPLFPQGDEATGE